MSLLGDWLASGLHPPHSAPTGMTLPEFGDVAPENSGHLIVRVQADPAPSQDHPKASTGNGYQSFFAASCSLSRFMCESLDKAGK